MKITKRQLRRIIKEEHAKLLKERSRVDESREEGQRMNLISNEDTIQEVFHKHFHMAEEELYDMGIELNDMGMVQYYVRMAINSYQGV